MFSLALVVGLALTAAITDLWRRKIYNWTTYPGIIAACIVNTIEPGAIGFEESLKGCLFCGSIMLVCFVLFGLGGGDVKLLAMLGACLGLHSGLEVMLWTFILGAILGLSLLIWSLGFFRLVTGAAQQIWSLTRNGSWSPLSPQESLFLKRRLHLAPAAFVAVLIVKFSLLESWL